MYLKADTMPQVEMYSNLLEGFVLLSSSSLTSCFRVFNLRSLFCNLVIFLFNSTGFSISYSFLSFTLLVSYKVNIRSLITSYFSLVDIEKAFLTYKKDLKRIKIIIKI